MKFLQSQDLRDACDAVFWTSSRQHNPGPIPCGDGALIFCHTDMVFSLFKKIRTLPWRYVIVTHESDHSISPAHALARPWNAVEWWSPNVTSASPACHLLPLGLANDQYSANLKPAHFAPEAPPLQERSGWLYVNHREETNPAERHGLLAHFRTLEPEGWVRVEDPPPTGGIEHFARALATHKFVLCPPGNGLDTHRMWEVLCAGAIPVVKKNPVTLAFAKTLPLLVVEDLREVSPHHLHAFLDSFRPPANWRSELMAPTWIERLQNASQRARRFPRTRLLWNWLRRKFPHPSAEL